MNDRTANNEQKTIAQEHRSAYQQTSVNQIRSLQHQQAQASACQTARPTQPLQQKQQQYQQQLLQQIDAHQNQHPRSQLRASPSVQQYQQRHVPSHADVQRKRNEPLQQQQVPREDATREQPSIGCEQLQPQTQSRPWPQEISEEYDSVQRCDGEREEGVKDQRYTGHVQIQRQTQPRQQRQERQPQNPFRTKTDTNECSLFETPLARTMKIDTMVINYGPKTSEESAIAPPTTNNIVDIVSYISASWKKQAEAFAFNPVEQVDFFTRQYHQLMNVLSISLFNRPVQPTSMTIAADKTPSAEQNVISQKKQMTKRNTTPSNANEIIIFENNGMYAARKIESVEKYVKRNRIPRFIRIKAKSNDAKHLIALLKTIDPSFAVGKDTRFGEGQSITELFKRLKNTFDEMSLETQPSVAYVEDDNSMHARNEDETEVRAQEPPMKKAKITIKKQGSRSNKNAAADDGIRPSGVEMNTDDTEEDTNDGEAKKGETKKNESDDSDSEDDSETSSDSASSDDEEQHDEVTTAVATQEYVPIPLSESMPMPSRYVPTPIVRSQSPAETTKNPSSPLFPDSHGKSKKRKHRH